MGAPTLLRMVTLIKARAVRRSGELLKQIEPGRGGDRSSEQYQSAGDHTLISREDAARDAGMSRQQQMQATRVANVPADQFEAEAKLLVRNGFQGLKHRGTSG